MAPRAISQSFLPFPFTAVALRAREISGELEK